MRAERSRPPTLTPLRARATPQVERTLRDAEDSQAAVQNTEEFVEIQLDLLRNRVLRFFGSGGLDPKARIFFRGWLSDPA